MGRLANFDREQMFQTWVESKFSPTKAAKITGCSVDYVHAIKKKDKWIERYDRDVKPKAQELTNKRIAGNITKSVKNLDKVIDGIMKAFDAGTLELSVTNLLQAIRLREELLGNTPENGERDSVVVNIIEHARKAATINTERNRITGNLAEGFSNFGD